MVVEEMHLGDLTRTMEEEKEMEPLDKAAGDIHVATHQHLDAQQDLPRALTLEEG
jgi:hypothetical protein